MKQNNNFENISLAKYKKDTEEINVTIQKYNEYVINKNKELIAEFLYQRLYERYLKPFEFEDSKYRKDYKSGFSIMANCCLLIETLESFKKGWENSDKKSNLAFNYFLKSEPNFNEFSKISNEFYKNVRCGILHQGETTAGYRINRSETVLYNPETKTINAVLFAKQMKVSLQNYKKVLIEKEWDSEEWDNFRVKMRKIIENCKS